VSKPRRKVLGWVGGVFVAGALALGLTVGLATPAYALSCANDGVWFLGSKPSQAACKDACEAIHGTGITAIWNPTTTCCKCVL
jgi:hypothetical protein